LIIKGKKKNKDRRRERTKENECILIRKGKKKLPREGEEVQG
jgi:hypothetical protein